MENIKSEFHVIVTEINHIDIVAYPMHDEPYTVSDILSERYAESSKYELECIRICKKHGWSLEEFDAELDNQF